MEFRKWLMEVGSDGGPGGGLTPPLQKVDQYQGAFADYHGEEGRNPSNPEGNLPPVKKKKKKKKNTI